MRLALYQPDIPQNTGTILRMAACLGVGVDVIGPTGFDMGNRSLRRAGLDYLQSVELCRHGSWEAFTASLAPQGQDGAAKAQAPEAVPATLHAQDSPRLILLTTAARQSYVDFAFRPDDTLLLGRESAGVPQMVHDSADARLVIPLCTGMRSLNIALAAAMALGEALRQTNGFSKAAQR